MRGRHPRKLALIASGLLGLGVLIVPTVGISSCASAQRNPDSRPGLRRRADESRRDLDRTIETNKKNEQRKP